MLAFLPSLMQQYRRCDRQRRSNRATIGSTIPDGVHLAPTARNARPRDKRRMPHVGRALIQEGNGMATKTLAALLFALTLAPQAAFAESASLKCPGRYSVDHFDSKTCPANAHR